MYIGSLSSICLKVNNLRHLCLEISAMQATRAKFENCPFPLVGDKRNIPHLKASRTFTLLLKTFKSIYFSLDFLILLFFKLLIFIYKLDWYVSAS